MCGIAGPELNKVVGAPGSGKGTLGHRLSNDYHLYHLSVGDHIGELSRDMTFTHRDVVQGYLQQGDLLPTELILNILRRKIESEKERGYRRFLIDGFPRQIEQGIEFEKEVKNLLSESEFAAKIEQVGNPALVIFVQCPKKTAQQRFLNRRLPDRHNDNEMMFKKRFDEFEEKNPPIVSHYYSAGKLLEVCKHLSMLDTYLTETPQVDSSRETELSYRDLLSKLTENDAWKMNGNVI